MNYNFNISNFLLEYLITITNDQRYKQITDLFEILNTLNNNKYLKFEIDLDEIETNLVDYIIEQESNLGQDVFTLLCIKLKSFILKDLKLIGLSITEDITMSNLLHILNTINNSFDIEPEFSQELISLLRDETYTNIETFSIMVRNNTGVSETLFNEVITDVDTDFLDNLMFYLKQLILVPKEDDREVVDKLLILNKEYAKTDIIKRILKEGYVECELDEYLDDMYLSLNKAKDIKNMALEIVATFTLGIDSRLDIERSMDINLNLEALQLNDNSLNNLKQMIDDYLIEILNRL